MWSKSAAFHHSVEVCLPHSPVCPYPACSWGLPTRRGVWSAVRCRRSSAVCLLETAGVGCLGSSGSSCRNERSHVSQVTRGQRVRCVYVVFTVKVYNKKMWVNVRPWNKITTHNLHVGLWPVPGNLLIPWCQVTVYKAERCPVKHEGHTHSSFVTCETIKTDIQMKYITVFGSSSSLTAP